MRSVISLLDEAITVCKSQSELARRLGITPGDINDMVKNRRTVSPAMVGLLCVVLELDSSEAQRLAVEAIIATAKEGKRGVLRRAFFALSATGATSGEGKKTVGAAKATAGRKPRTKATGYTLSRVLAWLVRAGFLPLADAASQFTPAPARR